MPPVRPPPANVLFYPEALFLFSLALVSVSVAMEQFLSRNLHGKMS